MGWIKKELGKREIRCDCPQMPTPWKPEYSEWKREFEKIPIDENSVLVGTSAGGGFLVRWLGEEKVKIKKLILVSPGKVGNSDRLKEFYGDVFYKNVKDLVREKIVIYTSEDDIDYHINSAEEYNKEFGGKFVKFGKGYGHFTSKTLVGNDFPELLDEILNSESLKVFTTRPDTLFGVTFLVVSASHPELMSLVANGHEGRVKDFLRKLKSVKQEDLDKLDKEGVFTGSYAEHPLTGEKIPIWVGNFVVAGYGSGIVMGVPAHDERDFEFAKKYGLDVRPVVLKSHNESYSYIMGVNWRDIEKFDFKIIEKTKNGFFKVKISFDKLEEYKEFIRKNMKEGFWNEFSTKDGFYFIFKHKDGRIEEMELNKKTNDLIDKYGATFNDEKPKKTPENVYSWLAKNDFYKELLIHSDSGFLINSEGFDGLQNREAINHITKALESKNLGKKKIEYKLRDWLISRQRYWGTPIPMIYCDSCGIVPELERNLPVKLPEKVKYGKGNPLASSKSFVETKCPGCGRKAKRETDTMDTFFDSSWYYLRYLDAKNKKKPFDSKKVDYWMPINQYIGGAEHAVLHLIYARFFTKVLRDLGYFGKNKIDEPFSRLFNQGTLHAEDGRRMSKSYGNVVLPEVISKKYGMDAARLFLVSIASPDKNLNWSDKGIEGSLRFILQVVDFANNFKEKKETKLQESKLNRTIRDYTSDLEEFRYNLAVIKLRNLFDVLKEGCDKKSFESFLKMLSVICPHIAEELWSKIKGKGFVSLAEWPEFDKEKIDDELEEIEGRVEKTIDDAKNILKIVEDRGNKTNKIYIYVLPNELEFYDSKKLSVRIGKEVAVYSVSDKSKYDPSGIAKKTKPGRPGIYVE
ncbi:MAG: class I tRNA ligase family protein [Candidatus Pacearchaeota archaeon]|nr:class I tRNA ligase family protein [Candidatus Pacearchaeota archaeon]